MRMLSHDALTQALRVYELVERARLHVGPGHEAKLRSLVSEAASIVSAEKPVLRGVLSAQTKAAQDCDLRQWTPSGPIPLRRKAAEQPDAANDHLPASEQPGGNLA